MSARDATAAANGGARGAGTGLRRRRRRKSAAGGGGVRERGDIAAPAGAEDAVAAAAPCAGRGR